MPSLDRRGGLWRGAEGDETEAGVVDFLNLIPPPRPDNLALLKAGMKHLSRLQIQTERSECLGGESCICYTYHTFISTHKTS